MIETKLPAERIVYRYTSYLGAKHYARNGTPVVGWGSMSAAKS